MFLKALRIPIVQDTNHESDLRNHLTFRELPVLPAYTGRKRLKKKKRKKKQNKKKQTSWYHQEEPSPSLHPCILKDSQGRLL